MQSLLVPILLLLVFLLPPWLLVSGVVRMQRRLGWTTKSRGLAVAIVISLVAAVLNTLIVIGHFREISLAQLEFSWLVIFALLISWCCFWGHMLIRPLVGRRRRAY